MKKLITVILFITTLFGENFEADYKKALSLSLEFYDAQGAGVRGEDWRRVSWRKPSTLNDGADVGVDLSGGWFDAGDHVKFSLPMSYSATVLNWGYLEYIDGYKLVKEDTYFRENIKFVLDYIIKAYNDKGSAEIDDDVFYYQVGDAGSDHGFWGPPELMSMARPTYSCDKNNKCTEVIAGNAAALASGYLVFKDIDSSYASTLLEKAKKLYSFGESYQGNNGYISANGFYSSYSGYYDELAWGAIWLYKATKESIYLQKAKTYVEKSGNAIYWALSWDNVSNGVYLLLTKEAENYASKIEEHLNYWINGVTYSQAGLAHLSEWGSLRYASTTAFVALIYSDFVSDMTKKIKYREFGIKQINYILGNNPTNFSYLIGYGSNYPKNPHHRAAHNSTTNNINSPTTNTYTLNGALVGGPKSANDFDYVDDRSDYIRNEVATDYNAAFTGALAKMVLINPTSMKIDKTPIDNNSTPMTTTNDNPPVGLLTLFKQKIKDWSNGYCEEIAIQNTTSQPQSWEIDLNVSEDIYNFSNANIQKIDGKWIAKGLDYNKFVQPNGKITFNFCAGEEEIISNTTENTTNDTSTIQEPSSIKTSDGLEIVRIKTADWDKGFCETIKIYNKNNLTVEWNIELEVNGAIYTLWNAIYSQNLTKLSASGFNWNKIIQANKFAEFGFCANKTINTLVQKEQIEKIAIEANNNSSNETRGSLEVKRVKQSDWGSGYCEDIFIKNNSLEDKIWEVELDFDGNIYNIWNVNYTINNKKLIAKGVNWNYTVKSNSEVSFGFCANR